MSKEIIADLGDGLVLRRATKADTDALAKFNGNVHGPKEYATYLDIWVRELMSGKHPHISAEDFTVVEEIKTGKIVSSLNLIEQTWSYDGIEFSVGRPELVGTHKDFRRKGLVRKQMETIHDLSRQKGHLVQAITGIPWYYRMFGYEMTVNLSSGRYLDLQDIPKLAKDEKEKAVIRDATNEDIPFIQSIYEKNNQRNLLYCKHSSEMWKHDINDRFPGGVPDTSIKIIENIAGKQIGFLMYTKGLWGKIQPVFIYELAEKVSWLEYSPGVFRYLQERAEETLIKENEKNKKKKETEGKEFTPNKLRYLFFRFTDEHPVFRVFPSLFKKEAKPYAWYIRVEDIPAFINHIKPVLEKRLAASYLIGYSGEVKLNFYTNGIILKIENGLISSIEKWEYPDEENTCAAFPDLSFLHLLFGYREIGELTESSADCFVSHKRPEMKVLLGILFPKKNSDILPIE